MFSNLPLETVMKDQLDSRRGFEVTSINHHKFNIHIAMLIYGLIIGLIMRNRFYSEWSLLSVYFRPRCKEVISLKPRHSDL